MKDEHPDGTGALFCTFRSPEIFRGALYHNGERIAFHAERNPLKTHDPNDPPWLLVVDRVSKMEEGQ